MTKPDGTGAAATPLATYVIVAGIAALIGFGAVYAMRGGDDNSKLPAASAGATPANPPAVARNPLASGEMATFVFRKTPEPVAEIKFEDGTGAARTLADWKGKTVLLNIWATWCAPCRKEMPALDRLQKALGSDRFEVVALSVDRAGAPASKKFLEETKVENLKLYVESTSKSIGALRATGLPTTILIDREGREIGRLAGPAEWDSADAMALVKSVLP